MMVAIMTNMFMMVVQEIVIFSYILQYKLAAKYIEFVKVRIRLFRSYILVSRYICTR